MLPGLITLCRTAFSISLLCLLVTPVAFAAQQTTLPDYQHPVLSGLVEEPSTDPEATMQASTGIGGFLDQAGRLALPEGFSGSIDPAGFEMVLGEDGAPRFFPQGGPADPDERWDDQFVLSSGCDGVVNAIAQGPDGELYLGGGFLSCEGVAANGVVRFDPATQTFSALGSGGGNGVNSTVLALAVSGSDLYVGGNFTQANAGAPISANRIARWDGTSWSVLGSGGGNGIGGTVRALAMSGSDLYVGGQFTQVNIGAGITANYIARWDGSTWSSLGSGGGNGVSGTVFALAVSGTDLYVGGQFMEVNCMASSPCDGTVAMRIARWNGSTWLVLGSGGGSGVNDSVSALAVSGTDLYVGGQFTQVNCLTTWPCNGTAAIRIAHWNGMAWSALGSGGGNGVTSSVNTLAVPGSDLYVGGWFTQANLGAAITTNHIARWNGSTWSAVGSGGGNGVGGGTFQFVNALTASGSDLYVGGSFTQANIGNAITANRIVRWSGGAWSVPVGGEGNGANDIVEVLAVSGNDLFIGGHFTAVGGTSANRIARWNGSVWSAIGSGMGNGVNNTVNALAVSGSDLDVGGSFTQVNCATSVLSCDGIVANRVARWNGSTWSAIGSGGGNGVGGGSLPWVYALSVSGDDLYVGGNFTQANVGAPIIANHIAHWNGSSW
ncbi:MAG: hypothetical protein LAT56_04215 [Wenzhouxiangella sp.]|nr:hypothetical protein [Wenzhouxiangella sp.]